MMPYPGGMADDDDEEPDNLWENPVTFEIEYLGWNFTLRWEGDQDFGMPLLFLNHTDVTVLEPANYVAVMRSLYRSTILDFWANSVYKHKVF